MTENNLFSSLFPDLEILVDNYNIINLTFLTKKDLLQKKRKIDQKFLLRSALKLLCNVRCSVLLSHFLISYTSIHKQVK